MEKQNVYKYILLGKVIRFLKNPGKNLDKDGFLTNIRHIYAYCSESGLKVSEQALLDGFGGLADSVSEMEDGIILDEGTINKITETMISCEKTLDSECKIKNIYELHSIRLDVDQLLYRFDSIIENFGKLDNLAKYDFENGCKALAYGLWTASVFHFMRVIENLTYRYAKKLGVIRGDNEMMGTIITKLQKLKGTTKKKLYSEKVIEELYAIKEQYRNPTQHPEAKYGEGDAEDLYYRIIAVINGITKKL